ncbi:hypothetical protein VSH64_45610 [Amycolatopsis rhabdoformis]|uniref:Uncharacterized protein n=1 Tax=Amycolatopsis rhabdoformis TaxID=1448059 RepID=A0ABZ1I994_9PSEU|nr:hypothetical protein [Amycolatopsis rhabdoformis]WSE29995.1 hypothetical protein VSH64_45610 [Amycolatopsis rhabdoformis]
MRRWIGSTKNIAGCLGGLIGLVLYVVGVIGPLWLMFVVMAVLYTAGALVAPPEKVRLVVDPTVEAAQVRASLEALVQTVVSHAGRLPAPAIEGVRHVAEVLEDLLKDPLRLASTPDLQYRVLLLARTDLPLSVETYLNLPRWFASRRDADGTSAEDELTKQLDLLRRKAEKLAEEYYAADVNRQEDHTRYLGEES